MQNPQTNTQQANKPVVVKFGHYETDIAPTQFGKQDNYQGNRRAELILQLFKTGVVEERKFRIQATLSDKGIVSFQQLILMNLSNSVTNNTSMQNRPIFVSHALDPNRYETKAKAKRIMYNDSNPQVVKTFFHPENKMNSLIVKGSITGALIPKDNAWDNKLHNKHAFILAKKLETISESNAVESEKSAKYQKAWDEYQAVEQSLIEQGLLVSNNVVVADINGLIPNQSLNQYSRSSNKFLDAKSQYSNENSEATFVPLLNIVNAIVDLTDTTSDPHTAYTYGMSGGSSDDSDTNTGIKRFSSVALAYGFNNQLVVNPIRVVVSDLIYNTKSSRSENFMNFKEKNPSAIIRNGQLMLAPSLGGYTSMFSIEGNNIQYSAYKAETNNNSNVISDDFGTVDDLDLNTDFVVDESYLDDSGNTQLQTSNVTATKIDTVVTDDEAF